MRALVLVLLGGTLMYLVWAGFGRPGVSSTEETAGGEAAEVRASGRMRSVAEIEAALAEEAAEVQEPAPEVTAASARAEETPRTPVDGGSGQSETSQDDPMEWNLGDPVAEGSLLLHDVERLPEYLKVQGRELSEGRKNLLFGFGLLVRGLNEHAERYREKISSAPDVTAAELGLFLSILDGGKARPLAAGSERSNPLLLGVRMALLEREAGEALRAQRYQEAAETFSALLLGEIDAPWPEDRATLQQWGVDLAAAQAQHRWNRNGAWPSIGETVERGDSLVAVRKRVIAERPDFHICTGLLARANQIGEYLQPGPIRIPTDPVSALVDLSAFRVFYMHGDEVVATWEVAVGREGKTTAGAYVAGEKLENPPWFQAGRQPVPFGDPDNPLGTRWIAWNGSDSLGFHGTWEPETIGTAASEGCIRMRNEEVEELFEILPQGSRIQVRP